MRRLKNAAFPISLIITYLFTIAMTYSGEPSKKGFASPSGKIEVVFTKVHGRKSSEKEKSRDTDNAGQIAYRLDFFKKDGSKYLASAIFNPPDVYGLDKDPRPASQQSIFKSLRWSPKEDFVILPEEASASAPGTATLKAVSLNPALQWKEAGFSLDNFVWIDHLSGIGDYHNDCDYGVARFEGMLGITAPVMASESPIGYELVSVKVKVKGDTVLIRQVLDNCRLAGDQHHLCFSYDLKTGEKAPAQCPAPKKKR